MNIWWKEYQDRLSNVNYLGPPYGNYFCRFLRLDLRRFLLKLAVMVGFGSTIALDLPQIHNDGVMDDAIYCRHRSHRVFENLVPLAKDQIRGNDHGSGFIALGEEREEHFHLLAVLLDIADVIEDDAGELIDLSKLLGEPQL